MTRSKTFQREEGLYEVCEAKSARTGASTRDG